MAVSNTSMMADLEGGGLRGDGDAPPTTNQRFVSFQQPTSTAASYDDAINNTAATTPSSAGQLNRHGSLFNSLSGKSIDDEMDEFEKAEDLEASVINHATTPMAEPGVPFEDGANVGRFAVTKRQGLTVGSIEEEGAADSHQVKLIVVLFGWLTCQDKHLYKYAQMYHTSIGMEVVLRHTVPTGKILRRKQRGVVRAAEEMMKLVPLFFPNAKVVVHYFSNGGCFVHRRMLHLMNGHYERHPHHFYDGEGPQGEYIFPQLAATIFDSCPAAADASTGAKAVSAALRGALARVLVYATVRFGLEVYGVAQFWRFERKYLNDIGRDHLLVPSLYIYSDDDIITDAAIVEKVVATRKAYFTSQGLPADVMIETWKVPEPSSHVCHYARHPAAYKLRLQEFLRTQGLMGT